MSASVNQDFFNKKQTLDGRTEPIQAAPPLLHIVSHALLARFEARRIEAASFAAVGGFHRSCAIQRSRFARRTHRVSCTSHRIRGAEAQSCIAHCLRHPPLLRAMWHSRHRSCATASMRCCAACWRFLTSLIMLLIGTELGVETIQT